MAFVVGGVVGLGLLDMWESRERRLRLKREEEAERFAAKREADKLGDVVFENDPTTKASDDWTGIYERVEGYAGMNRLRGVWRMRGNTDKYLFAGPGQTGWRLGTSASMRYGKDSECAWKAVLPTADDRAVRVPVNTFGLWVAVGAGTDGADVSAPRATVRLCRPQELTEAVAEDDEVVRQAGQVGTVTFEGEPAWSTRATEMGTYVPVQLCINGHGVWRNEISDGKLGDNFMYRATTRDGLLYSWAISDFTDAVSGKLGTSLGKGDWQTAVCKKDAEPTPLDTRVWRVYKRNSKSSKTEWTDAPLVNVVKQRERKKRDEKMLDAAGAVGTLVVEGLPGNEYMGHYELITGNLVNGHAVWQSGDHYIFVGSSGSVLQWMIGLRSDMQAGKNTGFFHGPSAETLEAVAPTPDCDTGVWKRWKSVDSEWAEVPLVRLLGSADRVKRDAEARRAAEAVGAVVVDGQPQGALKSEWMGTYEPMRGTVINGHGVWRAKNSASQFLFVGIDGQSRRWCMGDRTAMQKGSLSLAAWQGPLCDIAPTPDRTTPDDPGVCWSVSVDRTAKEFPMVAVMRGVDKAERDRAVLRESRIVGSVVVEGQPLDHPNAEWMGKYELMPDFTVRGCCVWQRSDVVQGHEIVQRFLFMGYDGGWRLGDNKDWIEGKGQWRSDPGMKARTPDCTGRSWKMSQSEVVVLEVCVSPVQPKPPPSPVLGPRVGAEAKPGAKSGASSSVVKQGKLEKLSSGAVRRWQERLFTLFAGETGAMLTYTKDRGAAETGRCDLSGAFLEPVDAAQPKLMTLLLHGGRVLKLQAPSAGGARSWREQFTAHISVRSATSGGNPFTRDNTPFELQEDFPPVILSYATKSNGGCGKEDMWAIANVLRNNGIASFNGYQVKPGEDWQSKWYGKMPEAKICVLILSKEYFTSKACVRECVSVLKLDEKVTALPVQFGSPNMSGHFLGDSVEDVENANLIKQRIRNWLPPPDQGTFQDNFELNAERLIARIAEIYSQPE